MSNDDIEKIQKYASKQSKANDEISKDYKISTNNTDLLHTFEKINSNNKVILSHLTKNQSKQEIFIRLEIEFEIELSTINKTKQNVTNINWLKYDKTYNKNITCDFFSLLQKECLPSF